MGKDKLASWRPMKWTVTGAAYGNTVAFKDGSTHAYTRRERPHLLWKDDVPLALTNGVQYGGKANAPNGDGVFTLSQGLRTASTADPGCI